MIFSYDWDATFGGESVLFMDLKYDFTTEQTAVLAVKISEWFGQAIPGIEYPDGDVEGGCKILGVDTF